MIYYAKIINEETKECKVGLGTNRKFYASIGMTKQDVEPGHDGSWYLKGYAPVKPAPTKEEQQKAREEAYRVEVDPITAHINRLRDEKQTAEVIAEIAALVEERKAKVEEIKQRFPYPVEETNSSDSVLSEDESEEVIEYVVQRQEKETEC